MITDERRAELHRQTVTHSIRTVVRDNPDMPMPGGDKDAWVSVVEEMLGLGASPHVLVYAIMTWHRQYKTIEDLGGRPVLGMWLAIVRNQTEENK